MKTAGEIEMRSIMNMNVMDRPKYACLWKRFPGHVFKAIIFTFLPLVIPHQISFFSLFHRESKYYSFIFRVAHSKHAAIKIYVPRYNEIVYKMAFSLFSSLLSIRYFEMG